MPARSGDEAKPAVGADDIVEDTVAADGTFWEDLDSSPVQPTTPASTTTSAASFRIREPCDIHSTENLEGRLGAALALRPANERGLSRRGAPRSLRANRTRHRMFFP